MSCSSDRSPALSLAQPPLPRPPLILPQVDATWHGHHHSYQRTCPLFRGRCQAAEADGAAGGTVHLVIGGHWWPACSAWRCCSYCCHCHLAGGLLLPLLLPLRLLLPLLLPPPPRLLAKAQQTLQPPT